MLRIKFTKSYNYTKYGFVAINSINFLYKEIKRIRLRREWMSPLIRSK